MKEMIKIPTAIVHATEYCPENETPKAILEVNGRYFIERVIDTLIISGIDQITIILGKQADNILNLTDLSIVNTVIDDSEDESTLNPLRLAFQELDCCGDILFFPVDYPLVKPETISRLIECATQINGKSGVRPVFKGRRGYPILFRKSIINSVLKAPPELGLEDLLSQKFASLKQIQVEDPGIYFQLNTQEDFRRAVECLMDEN